MRLSSTLFAIVAALNFFSSSATAQKRTINGPAGSKNFGQGTYVLTNGNYVVTDPKFDNGSATEAGAVYLFDGKTHALISTLIGSGPKDRIGTFVVPLSNGNFVVGSPNWHDSTGTAASAATWVDGIKGLNGVVSPMNSLVGDTAYATGYSIQAFPNGNYVVNNPAWRNGTRQQAGSVTWGNGKTGISGPVSSSNSLVGADSNCNVGLSVQILSNGDYVVLSPRWNFGNNALYGAVTWCAGNGGRTGVVDSSNSLVGRNSSDQVGGGGITELKNGNYVVSSPRWASGSIGNAGAVTWCKQSTTLSGSVSISNSMVGSSTNDGVGGPNANLGILALTNGNYVILSPNWNWLLLQDVGAATWCNGTTGSTGKVDNSNSLIGSTPSDLVGYGGTVLPNGNYVIRSRWADAASVRVGAYTWCIGTTSTVSFIDASNSLVGSKAGDLITGSCTALTNGNYVVMGRNTANGSITSAGSATWCNGATGGKGVLSISNSLMGSHTSDQIAQTCLPLANGNYVLLSPFFEGSKGATTWCDGSTGRTGIIDSNNSLIGTSAYRSGVQAVALTNGNYVTYGPNTVTMCLGTTPVTGTLSSSNSIVNTTNPSVFALTNGNAVVSASNWNGGMGAVNWLNGFVKSAAPIGSSNSLVGSINSDHVGTYLKALPDGNYVSYTNTWYDGTKPLTAVTLSHGGFAMTGAVDTCNSATGNHSYQPAIEYNSVYDYLITGFDVDNKIVILTNTQVSIASGDVSSTRVLSSNDMENFLDTANKLICSVQPTTTLRSPARLTARLFNKATALHFNSQTYARRHFDLSTINNLDTGSVTTTLYFTQADFDDFNVNNGTSADLPKNPTDLAGIANVKITFQRGTSATGDFGSYSGWQGSDAANLSIDPLDANIVWDPCESRWAVTFDHNGYGGMFLTDSAEHWPVSAQSPLVKTGLVKVTPIPATEFVKITCSSKDLLNQPALIFDVQGRVILRFALQSKQEIDISRWAAGMYYMKVGAGEMTRFIKQ